ncbi:hypothetical protein TSOC_010714 [Tetrabaena socialis]|uniref:RING-type domain-containing protein n=1 Tax=Tetrabaena socialis TaxID=47790 RepID=A0A2J7ZSJ7_9CHLO|nr:hypothetical protein TSOC_010714 [Tetrabaena socialis]|eukprot:PNH03247.1 hypothetical protein TSOC_010714 [Tetrabaena socialis]
MGAACTKRGREEAAFLKAARDGDCGVVQQAILRHVDWGYRAQTWNGQTVFHLAARYGRLDVLETVVEAVRFNPAGPDKWRKLLRSLNIALLGRRGSRVAAAAGTGGNKAAPGVYRSRSLRSLLTGAGRQRRSLTLGTPAGPGGGDIASQLSFAAQALALEEGELDDILYAMQPPDADARADAEGSVGGAAGGTGRTLHGSDTTGALEALGAAEGGQGSGQQRGRPPLAGGSRPAAGGALGFWRRATGQLQPQASAVQQFSADVTVRSEPPGAAEPSSPLFTAHAPEGGSLHASHAYLAATSAGAPQPATPLPARARLSLGTIAASFGSPRLPHTASPSATSSNGALPLPPLPPHPEGGAAAVRSSTLPGRPASLSEVAGGAGAAGQGPPRPPSASAVPLAATASGALDTAVAAVLANLAEAPQQVLRRYRLLQLTQGVDLHDLLRDHSELAGAAGGGAADTGPPGVGGMLARTQSDAASQAAGGRGTGQALPGGAVDAAEGSGRRGAGGAGAAPSAAVGSSAIGGSIHGAAPAFGNSAAAAAAAGLDTGPAEPSWPAPPAASSAGAATPAQMAGHLLRALSSQAASEIGENMCGVCFDQPDCLSITGCGHRLCADCSRELCTLNTFKPALCPFCRGYIGGFKFTAAARP